ncbi:urease accessory protein UreF [Aneurinibacillus terranovensis]|uniref:urease accessory protein UreF n=1 Tax=Aneurinibacillus terranovensis TaxID=278991 RepID=UPI00041BA892|nr:urease accessory UreF family protein [Aneurinibacillus terranovensis]
MNLSLLQLIDSSFPTGAFSHSFGLETALQEGDVVNGDGLAKWIEAYITGSVAPVDGAGVYWAYQYADGLINEGGEAGEAEQKLTALDQLLTLGRLAREAREAGIKIGRRYLHTVEKLYPASGLSSYSNWIRSGVCYGNPSIVHGWICAYLHETPQSTVLSYLYSSANMIVQNAMRAMAVGQTEGQKVLRSLLPMLERQADLLLEHPPSPDLLSVRTIRQEIAAMRHETLYSRLFMS